MLSIYNSTGHMIEAVDLAQYDDKDRLNALMMDRGFRKKTEEEILKIRNEKMEKEAQKLTAAKERRRKLLEKRKQAELLNNDARTTGSSSTGNADEEVVRVIDKKSPGTDDFPQPTAQKEEL